MPAIRWVWLGRHLKFAKWSTIFQQKSRHVSGAILHHLCVFNRKSQNKLAIISQVRLSGSRKEQRCGFYRSCWRHQSAPFAVFTKKNVRIQKFNQNFNSLKRPSIFNRKSTFFDLTGCQKQQSPGKIHHFQYKYPRFWYKMPRFWYKFPHF